MNTNVILELDRPRNLRYGSKALKNIEKIFNCKITEVKIDNLDIDTVTNLLHVGLQSDDPTLTLEQTEDLLDKYIPFIEQLNKFTEAFNAAFGVVKRPNELGAQIAPTNPTVENVLETTETSIGESLTEIAIESA